MMRKKQKDLDSRMEPTEVFFLSTIGWLAADILFASFNGSWYYVVGPVLVRRKGESADPAAALPSLKKLEKLTSDPAELDGRLPPLVFEKRNESIYTYRRRNRAGASLLQGTIVFDRKRGTYEVVGRVGIFFLIFLLSTAALMFQSGGFNEAAIFMTIASFVLIAFGVQDWFTCRKVDEAVRNSWR